MLTLPFVSFLCTALHLHKVPFSICGRERIDYRLPKNIIPIRYTVTLEPKLQDNVREIPFNGSVAMEFQPLIYTNFITMHAGDQYKINITSLEVKDKLGNTIEISSTQYDMDKEFFTIYLAEYLVSMELYDLKIKSFNGSMFLYSDEDGKKGGFYLAQYLEEGRNRTFALTQFETISARKAFPCMDEPAFKAKFTIKIIRTENYTTISNEVPEEIGEDLGNGRYQDTYAETVDMPPYLLAFVVSPLAFIQMNNHRVFARPQVIQEGKAHYALETGVELLEALSGYLGVNYTLTKMDQLAVPNDFLDPQAMENWGLVIYRENVMLCSNTSSTTDAIRGVTSTISHEFAHQWFGNLVTLKWWKYMWLNEGFAAFFEDYGVELIRPSWRMMDEFILIKTHHALKSDSSQTTPMTYEGNSPGDGAEGVISYFKASSVIRMMRAFLTDDIFQEGLTMYLNKYQFKAIGPADLYAPFQELLEEKNMTYLLDNNPLRDIMDSWTEQAGYPLITASMDYDTGRLTLSQQKFRTKSNTLFGMTWYVPINVVTDCEDNESVDIEGKDINSEGTNIGDDNGSVNIEDKDINSEGTNIGEVNSEVANYADTISEGTNSEDTNSKGTSIAGSNAEETYFEGTSAEDNNTDYTNSSGTNLEGTKSEGPNAESTHIEDTNSEDLVSILADTKSEDLATLFESNKAEEFSTNDEDTNSDVLLNNSSYVNLQDVVNNSEALANNFKNANPELVQSATINQVGNNSEVLINNLLDTNFEDVVNTPEDFNSQVTNFEGSEPNESNYLSSKDPNFKNFLSEDSNLEESNHADSSHGDSNPQTSNSLDSNTLYSVSKDLNSKVPNCKDSISNDAICKHSVDSDTDSNSKNSISKDLIFKNSNSEDFTSENINSLESTTLVSHVKYPKSKDTTSVESTSKGSNAEDLNPERTGLKDSNTLDSISINSRFKRHNSTDSNSKDSIYKDPISEDSNPESFNNSDSNTLDSTSTSTTPKDPILLDSKSKDSMSNYFNSEDSNPENLNLVGSSSLHSNTIHDNSKVPNPKISISKGSIPEVPNSKGSISEDPEDSSHENSNHVKSNPEEYNSKDPNSKDPISQAPNSEGSNAEHSNLAEVPEVSNIKDSSFEGSNFKDSNSEEPNLDIPTCTPDFSQPHADFWLTSQTATVDSIKYPTNSWYLINKQQTGFYRVNYDEQNWENLIAYLNSEKYHKIHVVNRGQILDDSFTLAFARRIPLSIPLRLSNSLMYDHDYYTLRIFLKHIESIHKIMAGRPDYEIFRSYLIKLFSKSMEEVGYEEKEEDVHFDKLKRAILIEWLCYLGQEGCRKNAYEIFQAWKNGSYEIPPDLRLPIYCGGMLSGNEDDWNFLLKRFEVEKVEDVKKDIATSLGCLGGPELLPLFFEKFYNENSSFPKSTKLKAFEYVSRVGLPAFDYLLGYLDLYYPVLTYENKRYFNMALTEIAVSSTNEEQLEKIAVQVKKHMKSRAGLSFIKSAIRFSKQYGDQIIEIVENLENVVK